MDGRADCQKWLISFSFILQMKFDQEGNVTSFGKCCKINLNLPTVVFKGQNQSSALLTFNICFLGLIPYIFLNIKQDVVCHTLCTWCVYFFPAEKKKTELCQDLSLHARDVRFQHCTSLTTRNNCIIIRLEVRSLLLLTLCFNETLLLSSKSTSHLSWLLMRKHFVIISPNQSIKRMDVDVLIALPNTLFNSSFSGDTALITTPFQTCVQLVCKRGIQQRGLHKIMNTAKMHIILSQYLKQVSISRDLKQNDNIKAKINQLIKLIWTISYVH